jgi:hypothetical protein
LSSAQTSVPGSPWLITLTPTVNPLPIGGCGPVWVTIKDSTGKSTPRDPAGRLITIADFDMSVTSANPNAVVGEYNGPSIWSACGHWDPASKRVTGASFLPLDSGALAFGVTQAGDRTTYARSGQEENVRRINQIVASVSPSSAVASYINGLYNGNVVRKGSLARSNYVPAATYPACSRQRWGIQAFRNCASTEAPCCFFLRHFHSGDKE